MRVIGKTVERTKAPGKYEIANGMSLTISIKPQSALRG
jgi:hypothetical protein